MTSTMKQLSQTSQKLHGKTSLLICGIPQPHLDKIIEFCQTNFPKIPFGIARGEHLTMSLSAIFKQLNPQPEELLAPMPPSIVFSGFTTTQIHQFIDQYKKIGIPSPLWGSRTITTDFWTLRQLLSNYVEEYQQMKKN